MIDPRIVGGLHQPEFDTSKFVNLIAQGQQRRMQQEAHQQEMELNRQRLATGERAAKAADLQVSEDAISRDALQESRGDMDRYVELVRQRAKSPATIEKAQTHQQAILKGALANQKEQGGITDARNERMAGLLDKATQLKQDNPEAYAQLYPQIHADIKSIDPEAAQHLDPNDPESLHLEGFGLHYASLKWGKQAADLLKQKADETRAVAKEGREVAAEADRSLLAPAQREKAIADASLATATAAGKAPIQPAQQAQIDEQRIDNERQERAATETNRHNQAMEARIAKGLEAGLSQVQNQRVMQIANGFDNEPIVKNYNVIAEGVNFAKSLGTGDKANAGDDQALLYSFAKVMDPGSVVREGEYATVQKYSQSWAQQFGFKAERIFANSPFLTDGARKLMKNTMEKKGTAARTNYDNVYNEYGRRIEKQAGVKAGTEFLTNYGQAFQAPAAPSGSPAGTIKMVAPDGSTKDVPTGEVDHYLKLGAKKAN